MRPKRDLGTTDPFTRKRSFLLDLAKAKSIQLPDKLIHWNLVKSGKTKEQHIAELEAYIENRS